MAASKKREYMGFNTICHSIVNPLNQKRLSSDMESSRQLLVKMIKNNNESFIFKYGRLNIAEKRSQFNPDWSSFFNKGHSENGISLSDSFCKFLSNLTDYLIINSNGTSVVCFEHFYNIRNELKKEFVKKLCKDENPYVEDQIFNDFYNFIFDNRDYPLPLEQATTVDGIIKRMLTSANDRFSGLTWLLLFSLYPNFEKADDDLLINRVLGPFKKAYSNNNKEIVTPQEIDRDAYSYEIYLNSLADKYNRTADKIIEKCKEYFENESTLKISASCATHYENIHLKFLSVNEDFNQWKFMPEKLPELIKEIEQVESKIDNLCPDKDQEFYWIEFIQLNLVKTDCYWKLSKYAEMREQLTKLEHMLYYNSNRTSENNTKTLLAWLRRQQGICFNRTMDFENSLRAYSSSYFLYDDSTKYERSKIKNNEAIMYKKWAKFDLSCKSYDEAYESRRDREVYDPDSIALVYTNMARVLIMCHKFTLAQEKIDKAYKFREKMHQDKKIDKWRFEMTAAYYAELYTVMGIYKSNREEQIECWEKAIVLFLKAKEIVDATKKSKENNRNEEEIRSFLLSYGILLYYQNNTNAENLFTEIFKLYDKKPVDEISTETLPYIIISHIYRAKYLFRNNRIDEAYQDLIKAEETAAKKLYVRISNPSFYRYIEMVLSFHLGAFAYLTNKTFENDAAVFISRSKDIIEKMVIDTELIDPDYKGTNSMAFATEQDHINVFSQHLDKPFEDLDEDTKSSLKDRFLNFYSTVL